MGGEACCEYEWAIGIINSEEFREPLKIHISSQLLRCGKNPLLTYHTYVALRNFFHALHLGEI
jgi:hypothetical protein